MFLVACRRRQFSNFQGLAYFTTSSPTFYPPLPKIYSAFDERTNYFLASNKIQILSHYKPQLAPNQYSHLQFTFHYCQIHLLKVPSFFNMSLLLPLLMVFHYPENQVQTHFGFQRPPSWLSIYSLSKQTYFPHPIMQSFKTVP